VPGELSEAERERYERQLALPELGPHAQQRLVNSSALVAGAGALGSPASAYLAAAGIGSLGVVDPRAVELAGVGRALFQLTPDVASNRAENLASKLGVLNPHVQADPYPARIGPENAEAILVGHDLVLDCTNDAAAHELLSDTCLVLGKPLVVGGVAGLRGWATTIKPGEGPCYRCFVPRPETGLDHGSHDSGSAPGAIAGIVGSLLALEAIKLLTGAGEPLASRLLVVDGLAGGVTETQLRRAGSCPACDGARAGVEAAV
jgi:molybdopterin/thiamine biosynthesis adenylyltransferase